MVSALAPKLVTQLEPRLAVLIPCYNEAATVAKVVADFRAVLPGADVYVYDNNSKDETSARAREAGAVVRSELRQGKGNVVRRMFADIEADVYILVDGDDTYDASVAPALIAQLIGEGLDIVSGKRVATGAAAYRRGHVLGNKLLTGLTSLMFKVRLGDMLTGYRIMSRRFVKSFPTATEGFGIETELTVHAVRMLVPMAEVDTVYKERPEGSISKLSTYRDGWRILMTIAGLTRRERPLVFYGLIFIFFSLFTFAVGLPLVIGYFETGLVPRLPTAVLVASTMVIACLSLVAGLILDTVTRGRWEQKRLTYLAFPGPHNLRRP
ncbi:glycosyltransferase family 2 protein [Rhizomicrobium electricum]|jgi:glycosyltransferase involved in cell wall biosynthesis|uniref:Glycosyltransferase family 2 protein n=1 Tax=Rhizomicrobium electricum TaxID=480070 RepID=A0ABN1EYG0_9PROT|nr:glycosyltransferase family 2 protein [Rhizomicrobium electricum]NIJ49826.1 glycosyltransferase involved in cell wall biosynthesis [Rhizomicrobium electricum]